MGKYIKLFNNHTQYSAFKASQDFRKPNVSHCIQENHVHYNPLDYSKDYLTFVAKERGSFSYRYFQNVSNSIFYSLDNGQTWTVCPYSTSYTPVVNAGDKVMWKSNGLHTDATIGRFSASINFDVMGNIMSLISGDSFTETSSMGDYKFSSLFRDCTGINSAEHLVLPSTSLTQGCYMNMFLGCTSLTTAPQLPATTLAEFCYASMFYNCTSLTTAPELPATTLARECYPYMFKNCTSLTTAPQLPATTLTEGCYKAMFENCSSLTEAPDLPALTLVEKCYGSQYNDEGGMFAGCSSLNYIKAMFTTMPETLYTNSWVKDVAANGTFVKNSAAQWNVTGDNGIPTGWTVETASE